MTRKERNNIISNIVESFSYFLDCEETKNQWSEEKFQKAVKSFRQQLFEIQDREIKDVQTN